VGTDYVPAVPTVGTTGEPFEVDPDRLDRSTRAHADLQNALANALRNRGIEPLSPALPADPEFDIAWRHDSRLFVCEVKTTTAVNRDRQLRLGLGQEGPIAQSTQRLRVVPPHARTAHE
jgi:hypothetical protein